jgi:hypothetical protein
MEDTAEATGDSVAELAEFAGVEGSVPESEGFMAARLVDSMAAEVAEDFMVVRWAAVRTAAAAGIAKPAGLVRSALEGRTRQRQTCA